MEIRKEMTDQEKIIKDIERLLNQNLAKRMNDQISALTDLIDERFCTCGHNRNVHENGEGGSPSKCDDCKCEDYDYSFLISFYCYYQGAYKHALPEEVSIFWLILQKLDILKIIRKELEEN